MTSTKLMADGKYNLTVPPQTPANSMPAEQSTVLAEFARACKTAARSVSLYPRTHPAIQSSLSRVIAAAGRLTPAGDVTLIVHPDQLVIDGRSSARPDPSIGDLAALLHSRMIGSLRVDSAADVHDWHAMLMLLSRAPEDLIAEGGIAKAWSELGRDHFQIKEIDYREVLRERGGGGDGAEWDAIIAHCLQGETAALEEHGLVALLDTLGDVSRFGDLLDRLQNTAMDGETTVGKRAAVLLQLVQRMLGATASWPRNQGEEAVLQTAADAAARLTPDMMLALAEQTRSPDRDQAQVASAVVDRITDKTIASFVAGSVVAGQGASERLALAFEALVPEVDRKERLLDLAKGEAEQSPLAQQDGFEELWQSAANMLASYSDERYVSAEYARELSGTKTQAIDVERVSDDPPDRIRTWLATVSDGALRQLDLDLLLDLLQVESNPAQWRDISQLAVSEIERRTQRGEIQDAQRLANTLVVESAAGGREALRPVAESALEALVASPFVRQLVLQLRRVEDDGVEELNRLAHTVGPRIIGPLTEMLVGEDTPRTLRRLRELLFGFGAAGRQYVEQLKRSTNPAIRRTAIDLLRMFGGHGALADLASMLEDGDPEVQQDAIRAITQIGSDEAYAMLQQALIAGSASSATIREQLIRLRDQRAVPLFCYVLNNSKPRGPLVEVHAQLIEALSTLNAQPDSIATLRTVLHRGEWWAPYRTAALRGAAAEALARLGTTESLAVLDEAVKTGSRGVRKAARAHAARASRRARQKT